MILPVAPFINAVPGVLRMSKSISLIVRHTSTAVAVESGRRVRLSKPRCKPVRQRSVSFVAGSAWLAAALAKRNNRSAVVTMFSISELACASRIGMELISMAWFGKSLLAALSSASAARAEMQARSIAFVSVSKAGGRSGISLNGRRGSKVISFCSVSAQIFRGYVDAIDARPMLCRQKQDRSTCSALACLLRRSKIHASRIGKFY